MAVSKKKVTKRKAAKKKAVRRQPLPVEELIEHATTRAAHSEANKEAVKTHKKASTLVVRLEKRVITAGERVAKAEKSVKAAKTAKVKANAQVRLSGSRVALKLLQAELKVVVAEEKAAATLLAKLHMLHEKAYTKFVKEYERLAVVAAKVKPKKRKTPRKKRVAK